MKTSILSNDHNIKDVNTEEVLRVDNDLKAKDKENSNKFEALLKSSHAGDKAKTPQTHLETNPLLMDSFPKYKKTEKNWEVQETVFALEQKWQSYNLTI